MLIAIALAIAPAPAERPQAQARASVRILSSGKSSAKEWEKAHISRRREIEVQEPGGRRTLVRLIEFE